MADEKISAFIARWQNKGDEKSDTQKFWLEFLRDIAGLNTPENFIEFEKRVELSHISFIDAYIPTSGIIIEQKSIDVNLDAPTKQSDGTSATPFEQAKRYYDWLPASKKGRYIIVCNFQEFRVHDMEKPKEKPEIISLKDCKKLSFIVDAKKLLSREEEISIRAGELVGKLYDSIIERYVDPDSKEAQRSLNIFCVRVVFLLYAEDAGMFSKNQFHDYLLPRQKMARCALKKLFNVLNQTPEQRDVYLEKDLKDFPYVDGGLFEEKNIEFPQLDGEPLRIILEEMSEGFDWSEISPTIFGAVFESTLNPKTRHTGGMHYTSIENIHKVIDPLFLDELTAEFNDIMKNQSSSVRTRKLKALQKKLSRLNFFDPACGSGNFLTESYLSLRRLENKIILELSKSPQISFTDLKNETPIKISISQFYGLEINNFATSVARTALWIAESQMWNETKNIIHFYGEPLPLTIYNNIYEANALKTDWGKIVKPDYIMGNPPFLGYSIQKQEQKQELMAVFRDKNGKPYSTAGKIDYIAGWYYKACELIQGTQIKAAFVSTNSITQGEQVSWIFEPLCDRFKIHIDFAHQSFMWYSESSDMAHVHVVVIGFSATEDDGNLKRLYTPDGLKMVEKINFYLAAAPNVFAKSRTDPVSHDVPEMITGNRPADGGFLLLSEAEYKRFIKHDPKTERFIKRFMMAEEFINGIPRYCLWLVEATPQQLHDMPDVFKRVKMCKEDRLRGASDRQKLALIPHLFRETRNPKHYLAIPKTSSSAREYIPMGFLDDSVIPGDELRIILDANLYHFGILTSRVHMAWMRAVCGRFGMGYRYSKKIVYNCFVWPLAEDKPVPPVQIGRRKKKTQITREEHIARITQTAQKILDARALYPDSNFATLYNDITMPKELRRAHEENDAAVCEAYGWEKDISDDEIVAKLFELYYALIG